MPKSITSDRLRTLIFDAECDIRLLERRQAVYRNRHTHDTGIMLTQDEINLYRKLIVACEALTESFRSEVDSDAEKP